MKSGYTDQQLDVTIGRLLRAGVSLAAAVISIGAVVYLARHGSAHPEYRAFRGEPGTYRSISGILTGVLSGSGRAIIQLGLLLLMATPVARVALSVYAFLREHDYLYVGVALAVLTLLLFSLLGPHS